MDADAFSSMLLAARLGEGWALGELFRDLHPRIVRYLSAFDPAEAEDLASETWLDLAQGLERFQGDEASLRAFAFTIARRRLIDLQRRRTRRPSVPAEPAFFEDRGPSGDVEAEAVAELGTRSAIRQVAELPPDQAEVVLLRVLGGLSVDEVAGIMGKRPGTVRVIQHRALRRLAEHVTRESVTG
jgi:RNA polymerase sigma-70 factor (ECF subfamily)